MIHYASAGRRTWAFLLTILVDLVVLQTMRAATGGGEVGPAFGVWVLIHHVGLVVEGGTIGQRLAGLRVVRVDGERIGVMMACVRALSFVALSLPPLGLGVLWMLDQPERRTWHDLLGGSVVVRESALQAAASPDWADDPPWRRQGEVDAVDEALPHDPR